jgi:hypothetical protein
MSPSRGLVETVTPADLAAVAGTAIDHGDVAGIDSRSDPPGSRTLRP